MEYILSFIKYLIPVNEYYAACRTGSWDSKNVCRYRGVSTHKQSGKWVAQIKSGGKQVYLGFYTDQEDAARAYDQAVIHMQVQQTHLVQIAW